MNNHYRIVAVLFCMFAMVGCKLIPPSENEVKSSLEAVMRAFESASFDEKTDVESVDGSEAEVSFANEDDSVSHDARLIVLEQKDLSFAGTCSLDEFKDDVSGYLISGTMNYHFAGPIFQRSNRFYAEISGDVTLTGGKVETMDFSFIAFEDGSREIPKFKVNGKDFEFGKTQKLFQLLKQGLKVTGAPGK